jgi:hypothetical protein
MTTTTSIPGGATVLLVSTLFPATGHKLRKDLSSEIWHMDDKIRRARGLERFPRHPFKL